MKFTKVNLNQYLFFLCFPSVLYFFSLHSCSLNSPPPISSFNPLSLNFLLIFCLLPHTTSLPISSLGSTGPDCDGNANNPSQLRISWLLLSRFKIGQKNMWTPLLSLNRSIWSKCNNNQKTLPFLIFIHF